LEDEQLLCPSICGKTLKEQGSWRELVDTIAAAQNSFFCRLPTDENPSGSARTSKESSMGLESEPELSSLEAR
jgi:hypothetical protein